MTVDATAAARGTAASGDAALLEREAEVAELGRLLAAARGGRGALAIVEGPPGIGKSRLLAAVRGQADGFTVLRARGGELERDFPWGVARQLFEPAVVRGRGAAGAALLEGAAAQAAEPLGLAPTAGAAGGDAGFAALNGLFWLTVNLSARTPLLLAVDDAHWADAASLRFLAFLARRLEDLPVLLVAAQRFREPGAALDLAVEAGGAALVSPRTLSDAAVAELLAAAFGRAPDPELAAACQRATGGNPFLIAELVRHLREAGIEPTARQAERVGEVGPLTVARAVARRIASLPPGAADLAAAVAVLGTDVDLRTAAALAGLQEAAASRAADGLAAVHVLRPGRPLEFVHPVVRAAVRESVPSGERAALHARAARMLDALGAGPDRVAVHVLATEPAGDAWHVAILRAAARTALERGAPDAAGGFLRRALAEPPPAAERSAVLWDLGRAALAQGDVEGIGHFRAAAEASRHPAQRAAILRELGLAHIPSGLYADAVEVLEQAARDAEEADDDELRLLIEGDVITAGRLHPSTVERLRARAERLDPEALGDSPAARGVLSSLSLHEAMYGGTAAGAARLARRAMAAGVPQEPTLSNTIWDAPYALVAADELELACRVYDEVLARARARGAILAFARVSAFRSMYALAGGDVVAAESEARAALQASEGRSWMVRRMTVAFLVDALRERGELEEAHRVLEREAPREIPDNFMLNLLLFARGRLAVAAGRPEAALADLEELSRREVLWRRDNPAMMPWRSEAARAKLALGDRQGALRLGEEEHELARAWGTARAVGVALRTLGLARGGARGEKLLEEAVDRLSVSPARLEHARTLVELGAHVRRAGRRAAARDPLRLGLDLAQRCGARALAQRAVVELQASGARPRRLVLTGVEALTASERRVADMAARGMTNREIAQALFVTLRTVEVHLTHAYEKLGIGSRGELAGALGES